MRDVDALNRGLFNSVAVTYFAFAAAIRQRNLCVNPLVYDTNAFDRLIANGRYSLKRKRDWSLTTNDRLDCSELLVALHTALCGPDPDLSAFYAADVSALHVREPLPTVNVCTFSLRGSYPVFMPLASLSAHLKTFYVLSPVPHAFIPPCSYTIVTRTYASPPECLDAFFSRLLLRWLSLEPAIASFSLHLLSNLQSRLDLTVVEPDPTFVAINRTLFPELPVIHASSASLLDSLCSNLNPSCRVFPVDHSVPPSLSTIPLSAANYVLDGDDLTLSATLSLPLPVALPSCLSASVTTISTLRSARQLQCFVVLFHVTPLTVPCPPHVAAFTDALPAWHVSSQLVYCPFHGDPVAAHRLIFVGSHMSSFTSTELPLHLPCLPDARNSCSLLRFLNPSLNVPANAFTTTLTSALHPSQLCPSVSLPCPMFSSPALQLSFPPVLHPAHPSMEPCHSTSTTMFVVPFHCPPSPTPHFRCVSSSKILRLYLSDLDSSTFAAIEHGPLPDNLGTRLSGRASPWHSSQLVVNALLDTRLPDVMDNGSVSVNAIVCCCIV